MTPEGRVAAVSFPPFPVSERYVTRAQLAVMMAVSVRTIDQWRADGMPSETWGRRSIRFLPSQAIAWARQQHHEKEQAA